MAQTRPISEKTMDLARYLRRFQESTWSRRLDAATANFDLDTAEGADALKRLFGGMGSLNDIYLCAYNGQDVAPEDEDAVNAELSRLRDALWFALSGIDLHNEEQR